MCTLVLVRVDLLVHGVDGRLHAARQQCREVVSDMPPHEWQTSSSKGRFRCCCAWGAKCAKATVCRPSRVKTPAGASHTRYSNSSCHPLPSRTTSGRRCVQDAANAQPCPHNTHPPVQHTACCTEGKTKPHLVALLQLGALELERWRHAVVLDAELLRVQRHTPDGLKALDLHTACKTTRKNWKSACVP